MTRLSGLGPFAVSSSSFGTVVHISSKGCTLALFQRICCFLFIRLPIISLTALFINAVEIGSPFRRRTDQPKVPQALARGMTVEGA